MLSLCDVVVRQVSGSAIADISVSGGGVGGGGRGRERGRERWIAGTERERDGPTLLLELSIFYLISSS